MSKAANTRLVYASDGSHLRTCKLCQTDPCRCRQALPVVPGQTTVKIRIEKNGRGGKAVTVLFNLPYNPDYFIALTKKLKNHCGSGGTYKDEQIEIQGEHREKIKTLLETLGFKVKPAGG